MQHTLPIRAFVLLSAVAGCGGVAGDESGSAGARAGETSGGGRRGAASLHDDMVAPAPRRDDTTTVQGALGSGGGHEPKVFYLRYADGTETAHGQLRRVHRQGAEVRMQRSRRRLLECQRQIQAYLDAWYADFNIIFTLTRPTSGKYYTEVVSSGGGAWCKVDDKVAGVAPFLCKDLKGGVAYTFQGGRSARETAVIIAQEQAHLLGSRAHDQPERHHVPDDQHRQRRASSTRTARSPAIAATPTSRTRTR